MSCIHAHQSTKAQTMGRNSAYIVAQKIERGEACTFPEFEELAVEFIRMERELEDVKAQRDSLRDVIIDYLDDCEEVVSDSENIMRGFIRLNAGIFILLLDKIKGTES